MFLCQEAVDVGQNCIDNKKLQTSLIDYIKKEKNHFMFLIFIYSITFFPHIEQHIDFNSHKLQFVNKNSILEKKFYIT